VDFQGVIVAAVIFIFLAILSWWKKFSVKNKAMQNYFI